MALITYYLFQSYLHLNRETWGNCYLMCPVKPGKRTILGPGIFLPLNHTMEAHLLHLWVILAFVNLCWHKTPATVVWTGTIFRPVQRPEIRESDTALCWVFSTLSSFLPSLLRNLFFHFLHRITRSYYSLFANASELLNTSQKCSPKLQKNCELESPIASPWTHASIELWLHTDLTCRSTVDQSEDVPVL